MSKSVVAVVPAAGQGTRMGGAARKQYLTLGGIPLLVLSLKVFQRIQSIREIILSVPEDDREYCWRDIVKPFGLGKVTQIVAGGSSFSGETISRLKELARDNTPYVKASAIIGVTGLHKVVLNAVAMFSKRRFYIYDTLDEAMDFLAGYTD